ncbi:14787_t:CDS:10, partial [Acaulospora morrowiae]
MSENEPYVGYNALIDYLQAQNNKSYRSFLELNREVIISSLSVNSDWKELDNCWAANFLREAERFGGSNVGRVTSSRVTYYMCLGSGELLFLILVKSERGGNGLKAYWKEIIKQHKRNELRDQICPKQTPNHCESNEPKGIKRESDARYSQVIESQQSATESSSSDSDLGSLDGPKNKKSRSQYVRDDSSSQESTPCLTHTLTLNVTPNKTIINQVQEDVNNYHDNEENVFTLDEDDIHEEELEDSLLQENPGSIIDCKLTINDVCIRSAMEKWRKSSKYVGEIHKQDLMRYNIIDTTTSSATEARKLFNEHWDDIISTVEKLLTSSSTTQLASASASTLDTEQDGQSKEIKQYTKYISTNVNSAKKLREAIKKERAKLRIDGNIKWKRRVLGLMKAYRNQFPDGANYFKEDQTESDYIIRFISRVYTILFKDKKFLRQAWKEKTLRSSAILLNQSLKDNDRRCSGNGIDAIISMVDLDLEISVLEVSGSPTRLDHTHYVGDKNKIAKMLKIIINYIKTKYSGCYEDFRRIKVYGIQYVFALCWRLLFQTRKNVLLPDYTVFALQGVAKVRLKSVDDA